MTSLSRHPLNRRQAVGGALAALAGAGCLSGSRVFAQGTPIASPEAGTRIVTDYRGKQVEIPAHPQRVVALSLPILEISLAVGIKPVGSAKYGTADGFPAYFGDSADGIELVGDSELDFEKIISLQPDLAIMDYFGDQDAETVETLEKIVPVVTTGEFRENWRGDSAMVADFLNKREEFKPVEARYDARIAEITTGLTPDWTGKTVALLRFRAGDMRILKQNSFAGTVLADLGLMFPPIVDSGTGIAEDFSMEQAQTVDVDALFVTKDSGTEADGNFAAAITNPVFQSLNVVKNKRVYTVDQEVWITLRGYGASEIILGDVEKYLVNGEPAPALPGA
jgi:iron complex transport system substrate-binding protein